MSWRNQPEEPAEGAALGRWCAPGLGWRLPRRPRDQGAHRPERGSAASPFQLLSTRALREPRTLKAAAPARLPLAAPQTSRGGCGAPPRSYLPAAHPGLLTVLTENSWSLGRDCTSSSRGRRGERVTPATEVRRQEEAAAPSPAGSLVWNQHPHPPPVQGGPREALRSQHCPGSRVGLIAPSLMKESLLSVPETPHVVPFNPHCQDIYYPRVSSDNTCWGRGSFNSIYSEVLQLVRGSVGICRSNFKSYI